MGWGKFIGTAGLFGAYFFPDTHSKGSHLSPEFPLPVSDWKQAKSDPARKEETPHIFRLQKEPLSMQVYHSQAPVHLQD